MKKVSGTWGWIGLIVYIAVFDSWRRADTMSNAWYQMWTGNPKGKAVTLGAWVIVTLHLFHPLHDSRNWWKNDPINIIGRGLSKLFRR